MNILNLLQAVWIFPQNAIGFIVKKVCKATPYTTYKDAHVFSWNVRGGVSLGRYIFVPFTTQDPTSHEVQEYIKHEYGHTVQSKYLGWLYLVGIGLPSIIWAGCFDRYRAKKSVSYYAFYTERWADRLGGVEERTPPTKNF